MKLELLSKGSNIIGAGRQKAELTSGKNPWRGKFNRRKRPRNEDALLEFTPSSTKAENTQS